MFKNRLINLYTNLKHHQTVVIIMVALFILAGVATYSDYVNTERKISTQFQKAFEKKTMSELEIFHMQTEKIFSTHFEKSLQVIENIASDSTLRTDLSTGNFTSAKSLLALQRQINNRFDALGVIDSSGKMIIVSSYNPQVEKALTGQSAALREHYKTVTATKKPGVSSIYKAVVDSGYIQVFSAPVLDASGNFKYYITGTTELNRLKEKFLFNPTLEAFSYVLLDEEGKLIMEDDNVAISIVDVKQNYRLVQNLIDTQTPFTDQEINWKGEKVFARGSVIKLDSGNKVYLVSSYPLSQFNGELKTVKSELNRIFVYAILRNILLLFLAFLLIEWLMKRHEEVAHSQK